MANYRKSFNFRSGVQVDDDNFVVNPYGLVGIGTSVPTAFLDVRSTGDNVALKVVGLVTVSNLAVTGVSTFYSDVKIGSGITFNPSSGTVRATSFYGDGSTLSNIVGYSTEAWIVNTSKTGISTSLKVGIGTTNPQYSLQVGGDPTTETGFSVDETTGNVITTGTIVADGSISGSSFSGDINAVDISSGTISSDRLPVLPNSKIPNNFQVSGIITALGSFVGTLVGIASTATDLTSNAIISIVDVRAGISSVGVATVSTRLRTSGSVGVNTDVPYAAVHVVGSSSTTLHLTADTTNITLGRSLSPTGNTGGLKFGNTSGLYPSSTTKSLDIINYDTGNLNNYLHYGAAGVGTGNFNWIYARNASNPLMTLTYGGKLGIGITTPTYDFEVAGSAQVSSLNVTGSVYATGAGTTTTVRTLYVLGGENEVRDSDGISLFGKNINIASGISTFYNLNVSNNGFFSSIGIGTTSPRAQIDALNSTALFDSIGIGTTTPGFFGLKVVGISSFSGNTYIGINTTSGVVLTSQNGTQYRLFVENNGTLKTELI